jgi:DNA-binding transcriptional LysR family regulator
VRSKQRRGWRAFRAPADELHVTHGAVSHQVRALEDFSARRSLRETAGASC